METLVDHHYHNYSSFEICTEYPQASLISQYPSTAYAEMALDVIFRKLVFLLPH